MFHALLGHRFFWNSQSFIVTFDVLFIIEPNSTDSSDLAYVLPSIMCLNWTFLHESTLDTQLCVTGFCFFCSTAPERWEKRRRHSMFRFRNIYRPRGVSRAQCWVSKNIANHSFWHWAGLIVCLVSTTSRRRSSIDTRLQRGMETIVWELCCNNFSWGSKCPSLQVAAALQRSIGRRIGFASLLVRERLEATCEDSNARRIFVGFGYLRHYSFTGSRSDTHLWQQHAAS